MVFMEFSSMTYNGQIKNYLQLSPDSLFLMFMFNKKNALLSCLLLHTSNNSLSLLSSYFPPPAARITFNNNAPLLLWKSTGQKLVIDCFSEQPSFGPESPLAKYVDFFF